MTIKRFTPPVERIIPLVATDVGRPLVHFASNLRYEHLLRDVRQVLERLTSISTNIQTTAGEWYSMRILPYRTLDNYISGAVITFTDVTGMKVLESQLQEAARFAESVVETVREPLLVLDGDLRILTASRPFLQSFRLTATEAQGQLLPSLSNGAWDNPSLLRHLQELLAPATLTETATEAAFDSYVLESHFPELGRYRLVLYGRAILRGGHQTNRLLLGVETMEKII
ncbi:PAS domain-containing protein [Hymenobacter sp. 5516J-16]|nr:PAS domain-containing protein [Hymenobacter sp. 5516J-16]